MLAYSAFGCRALGPPTLFLKVILLAEYKRPFKIEGVIKKPDCLSAVLTVCCLWICSLLLLRPQTRGNLILLRLVFKQNYPWSCSSRLLMLWNSALLSARCRRSLGWCTIMIKVLFPSRKIYPKVFHGLKHPLSYLLHLQVTTRWQAEQPDSASKAQESTELLPPVTATGIKLTQCRDCTHISEQLVQAKLEHKNCFKKCRVLTLATMSCFAQSYKPSTNEIIP